MTRWQPIETAPKERNPFEMFAVIAKDVMVTENGAPYTTDPYYVSREDDGFARWPHPFPPTHWHPMPQFEDKESSNDVDLVSMIVDLQDKVTEIINRIN